MSLLAIKIDIDTTSGLKRVPALIDLFKEYDVCPSFFVPMGPDKTGKHISRLFRKDFLYRIVKINPLKVVAFQNLFYGSFLPSREIATSNSDILKEIISEGYELGLHGYDHYEWQVSLACLKPEDIRSRFNVSLLTFENIVGAKPKSTAAPGWKASFSSLKVQDRYGFLYASDTRGHSPFYPYLNSHVFQTLQIPTTLPTIDELYVRGFTADQIIRYLWKMIVAQKISVMNCHAEHEGGRFLSLFERLIRVIKRKMMLTMKLEELAKACRKNGPIAVSTVVKRRVAGLEGYFSFQGKPMA